MRIPHQYRTVAFTEVDVELDEYRLRELLMSRRAYRRTRFIVARNRDSFAIVEVTKANESDLFSAITNVHLLAGPNETVFTDRPDVDTAVPTQLTRVAAELGDEKRGVIVRGRYEHVNFVLDSKPSRVHVLDVAPPRPAKLFDQVGRLIDVAEDLAPTDYVPQVVELEDLAPAVPANHYLLPCRGGGMNAGEAKISYLDEIPEPDKEWVLLGCARSRQIHDEFYPDIAPALQQIDTCPLTLAKGLPLPSGETRLTKCCLLEEHIETHGDTVVVPWGASFSLVRQGLTDASELAYQQTHGNQNANTEEHAGTHQDEPT